MMFTTKIVKKHFFCFKLTFLAFSFENFDSSSFVIKWPGIFFAIEIIES